MTLTTEQLHPRFGVEVKGLQLAHIHDADFAELRDLFERHSVLLFRDQVFDDQDHIRLARRFGPIEDRNSPELQGGADFKVPEVTNIREDGGVTGEMDLHTLNLKANMLWHADSTFLPTPALANILVARVVTKTGGATELASTRAAWADMPEALKERIRDRAIWHRYSHSRARISPELAALPMFNKWPDRAWRSVWTNPVTGEEALYIASHAFAVEGLSDETAAALIEELIAFATRPEYVYRHAWREGDVLIWDQRAVLHRATPWNYEEPRKLSSICVSAISTDGVDLMRADV